MKSAAWHKWDAAEPNDYMGDEDCMIIHNYYWWNMHRLPDYVWNDYSCNLAGNEIQGYVCESKLFRQADVRDGYFPA